MTSSPFIDKSKFEGKPIIFQSSLSNSIIVDSSDKKSLPVDTVSISTTNAPDSTNETGREEIRRSDSIDEEIGRPSNEYVLVCSPIVVVGVFQMYEFKDRMY